MPLTTRMNEYFHQRGQRARRLILLEPLRPVSRGVLNGPRRIIDAESGQVSHETTSRELQVSEYHWDLQYEELLEAHWEDEEEQSEIADDGTIVRSSRRRVPRLVQLAMAAIVKNIANITYETVQHIGPLALEFIWRELNKRCLNSFNTWKIFSKFLDRNQDATLNQFRYSNAIVEPVPSLPVYTMPLTSTTFDFLVHLSITTAFSTSDLVELSALTNLIALEIINPDHGSAGKVFDGVFGDRVIKTWSESAIRGKGFQVLRILKLRNFEGVTNNCFPYINGFPVLAVFDVLKCGFKGLAQSGAERFGWVAHPDGAFLEILQSDCVKQTMALRTSLGLPIRPVRRPTAKPLWNKAKIKMMPRADMPMILAADRASSTPTAPNTAYDLAQEQVSKLRQTPTGRAKLARMGFSHFEAVDYMSRQEFRELETWEFRTYTALNRISELRSDEDLRAAGLDIGDRAPMVSGEIISAIPMASLRLGPHLVYPLARGQLHQPFYDGGMTDSSLKYTSRKVGEGAKGFVYTRIDWASISRTRTIDETEGGGEAGGSSSRQNKRRKVKGEKRQQLGDLLAGVMGVV